jgi:hypothetical protein
MRRRRAPHTTSDGDCCQEGEQRPAAGIEIPKSPENTEERDRGIETVKVSKPLIGKSARRACRFGQAVPFDDLAQQEREAISRRIRKALAAARARGVKLGCPNGAAHFRRYGNGLGVTALKAAAGARANGLAATIEAIKGEGVTSAKGIAKALNKHSMATPHGGNWPARSVLNVTARLA